MCRKEGSIGKLALFENIHLFDFKHFATRGKFVQVSLKSNLVQHGPDDFKGALLRRADGLRKLVDLSQVPELVQLEQVLQVTEGLDQGDDLEPIVLGHLEQLTRNYVLICF